MSKTYRDYGPKGCAEKVAFTGILAALLLTITRKGSKR